MGVKFSQDKFMDPLSLFHEQEGRNTSDDLDMGAWAKANRPELVMNNEAYNAYKNQALRKGPSAWLNLNRSANDLRNKDAIDRAHQEVGGVTAKANNDLAAGGGLSSGARERVAQSGVKNYLSMAQDLNRQNGINDAGLQVEDAKNKIGMMGNLTNMEANRDKAKSDYEMKGYENQLQAMAAQQQAIATENSGKKGK